MLLTLPPSSLTSIHKSAVFNCCTFLTKPNRFSVRSSSSKVQEIDFSNLASAIDKAAFLFTVVGITGFLGVLAGQLPGDWSFFVPYLLGSISLVVLAVGSISPGLLQAAISWFSSFFPDYQERIARHEAAHFLVAYLIGLLIMNYSLDIGKEHVNLIDERLEKLIYRGQLDAKELDRFIILHNNSALCFMTAGVNSYQVSSCGHGGACG